MLDGACLTPSFGSHFKGTHHRQLSSFKQLLVLTAGIKRILEFLKCSHKLDGS